MRALLRVAQLIAACICVVLSALLGLTPKSVTDRNALGAKSAPRVERRMNDVERAQDRMTVFSVLSDVDDSANTLLKQVNELFEPALLTMGRTTSERIDGPSTISRDFRV